MRIRKEDKDEKEKKPKPEKIDEPTPPNSAAQAKATKLNFIRTRARG